MRVITGSARGHSLKAPKGDNTRPTSDKVKESLFNIIGYIDEEDTVLDLFSGSGSVGIEFLSRGAQVCYFIDEDANSIQVIKDNLEKTKLIDKAFIEKNKVGRGINMLSNKRLMFDYIFLDPPYNKDLVVQTFLTISTANILKQDGIVIVEHETKLELSDELSGLFKFDSRKYGDTSISFYRKDGAEGRL